MTWLSSIELVSADEYLSEVSFCLFAVFLLLRVSPTPRSAARLAGWAAALFAAKRAVRWLLMLLPGVWDVIGSYAMLYLINPLLVFALGLLLRDLRASTRLVSEVVFLSLNVLSMGFLPNITALLNDLPVSFPGESLWASLLNALLMLPIVLLLKHSSVEKLSFLSPSYLVMVVLMSASSLVSSQMQNALLQTIGDTTTFYSGLNLFLFVVLLAVYLVFYRGSKEYNDLIEGEVINQKKLAESRMLELTENNLEEIRRFRHDWRNHCAVMTDLLRQGEYAKLSDYLQGLSERQDVFRTIQTGNKVVDSIVNTKHAEAAARGIRLETKCAVPPDLPIDETRLCSLIFNLLDNAIEAVSQDNCERRDIYFSLLRQGDLLLLCVQNSIDPSRRAERLSLRTGKQNPASHGYGMKIIRQIVADYNGTSKFYVCGDRFHAEILLTLEEGAAAHG